MPIRAIWRPRRLALVACWAGLLVLAPASHARGTARRPSARASPTPQRSDAGKPPPSVDAPLQLAADRLLQQANPLLGGLVAIEVETGRVSTFSAFERSGRPSDVLTQPRAPAASLFKLVTAVALLERTPVTPATRVCIRGGEHRIDRSHLDPPPASPPTRCHPFSQALGFSRNAVFAQLATQHLMHRDLAEVAESLGFNQPLAGDRPAVLGRLELPYNDLAFARAAAGFRGSSLSVLGAARLAQIIASQGRPQPLRFDREPTDEPPRPERTMRRRTANRLRKMMEITIHSGTCLDTFTNAQGASHLGDIRVAGKTGTLQPRSGGPITSWFIGFAPSRTPRVAIAVLLENAPVWRRKANAVGRDFLRSYFLGARGVSDPFAD